MPPDNQLRVLVLDDEPPLCDLVHCALAPLGYDVVSANDGVSAIAAYREALSQGRPFDLLITDLSLPGGIDGAETLRQLRSLDPRIEALICSGHSSDPVIDDFQRHGFCGVLRKPYALSALRQLVAAAIGASPR